MLLMGVSIAAAQTAAPPRRPATMAELERLYLDGKITAKEFQQYLKDVPRQPQPAAPQVAGAAHAAKPQPVPQPAAGTADARALEMLRKLTGKTNEPIAMVRPPSTNTLPNAAGKPAPSVVQPVTPPTEAANPAITEAEKKLNDLLRAKEAREKAAQSATNAPVSSAPKSKRQRLDDLLKQFIDGKMTEPEYKQRREKIIAEPE